MRELYDLAVIGGGPAGTTVASLMAGKGFSVILFEKDHHPRFHIGESLLPMNLEIFDTLGVSEQVAKIGVKKLGADFTSENKAGVYQTFPFARALGSSPPYAYEVLRSDLDKILFDNAKSRGVCCLEDSEVSTVKRQDDGTFLLESTCSKAEYLSIRARYVVDASGRDCLMSARNGWKTKNQKHSSAALFSHFNGVARRPAENQGNISIYWFKHGWIWMIPLPDDVMSIGAVCRPGYLKTRETDTTQFLMDTIEMCPDASRRLSNASLVGPVRATANYSYHSREVGEDGYLLVGDAYAFIDPVFSSGVYLAMSSAVRSLPTIEAWLGGNVRDYQRKKRTYRKEIDRAVDSFAWFIYRFMTPAMRNLFNDPRDILGVERGVISMLAGDVFANRAVRRRLVLFKCIYGIAWLFDKAGFRPKPSRQRRN